MRLLSENDKRQGSYYIPTPEFEENLQKSLLRDWAGFYIHGEGASGKSAMAGALIHYMMWTKMIYAPIWIEFIGTAPKTDDGYFINIINERLNITGSLAGIERAFSENRYLICFDITNIDNARLSELLKGINTFITPFHNHRPYLIIINRNYPGEGLPDNIGELNLIEPPELREEEIKILIDHLAEHGNYQKKIKSIEDTEEYRQFFSEIVSRLGSTPGLIGPAVNRIIPGLIHR